MVHVFLVIASIIYTLIFEYIAHKHVLHNYKNFKSAFKNHFKIHHGTSRRNKMHDPGYDKLISSHFEIFALLIILVVHFPVYFVSPFLYFCLAVNLAHYYYVHRKSHVDIEWGKQNLPWHYAHHMGKNQNINWGVRSPIIDKILGTSKY